MGLEFQVTFDSADPRTHAAFWAEALHYVRQPSDEGVEADDDHDSNDDDDAAALVDPDGVGPRLYFQRVPEPKTAKNRVHLDVRAAPGLPSEQRSAALEAECDRLVALGARQVRRLEPDGENDLCIVMQDPEGNEFCLD